jgi:holliday junction DNA helicase RuvA
MDNEICLMEDGMYAFVKGEVTSVRPTHIVIENNGIGYEIIVPNPYLYHVGNQVTVSTYHYVREDIDVLYGFPSDDSKALFVRLIGVSGIGPKSALSILATDAVNDIIMAVEDADVQYLKKFPGIGTKSAQQIILDLKGKLSEQEEGLVPNQASDAIDALLALGYSKIEIRKVMKRVDNDLPIDALIKSALKMLMK